MNEQGLKLEGLPIAMVKVGIIVVTVTIVMVGLGWRQCKYINCNLVVHVGL